MQLYTKNDSCILLFKINKKLLLKNCPIHLHFLTKYDMIYNWYAMYKYVMVCA